VIDTRKSYRIVTDRSGNWKYACQYRLWWWPIWITFNYSDSPGLAESRCHSHAEFFIKNLGKLP
jgi:hypothetical protein